MVMMSPYQILHA